MTRAHYLRVYSDLKSPLIRTKRELYFSHFVRLAFQTVHFAHEADSLKHVSACERSDWTELTRQTEHEPGNVEKHCMH